MQPLDRADDFPALSRYHKTLWVVSHFVQKWLPLLPVGCALKTDGWFDKTTQQTVEPALYHVRTIGVSASGETIRGLFVIGELEGQPWLIDGGEPDTVATGAELQVTSKGGVPPGWYPTPHERATYEQYQRFVVDVVTGQFEEAVVKAQQDFEAIADVYDACLEKAVIDLGEELELNPDDMP